MNYKDFARRNPEQLPQNAGYTEYLSAKFKSIADYLNTKHSSGDKKVHFEGNNVVLLENIARQMELLIDAIDN